MMGRTPRTGSLPRWGWLLVFVCCSLTAAQTPTAEPLEQPTEPLPAVVVMAAGDIQGVVTGTDAATPLPGLTVTLLDAATGLQVAGAITDEEGAYVLADVPAGTYRLTVGEPGIAATLRTTDGGDQSQLNVIIPQLLVAAAPSDVPAGLEPSPAEATAIPGEEGTTLVAMPAAVGAGGEPPGQSGGDRRGPPDPFPTPPPYPGPPPWPPGPPPWPPPWISPIRP